MHHGLLQPRQTATRDRAQAPASARGRPGCAVPRSFPSRRPRHGRGQHLCAGPFPDRAPAAGHRAPPFVQRRDGACHQFHAAAAAGHGLRRGGSELCLRRADHRGRRGERDRLRRLAVHLQAGDAQFQPGQPYFRLLEPVLEAAYGHRAQDGADDRHPRRRGLELHDHQHREDRDAGAAALPRGPALRGRVDHRRHGVAAAGRVPRGPHRRPAAGLLLQVAAEDVARGSEAGAQAVRGQPRSQGPPAPACARDRQRRQPGHVAKATSW